MSILCSRCQSENPDEMRFCGQCAAPLAPATVTPSWTPRSGERRQLTVLFCDLVGSTELSQRLDPEDLSWLLRTYHDAAGGVIRALDGHIAQYLGDGLLVYFGYPIAHEDSAVRAVRASLRVIEAIREVNPRVKASLGTELRVRVGIHTGLVMVGDVGAEQRHERLAVGETPNLAARVQGQAAVDSVVVSEATWKLVSGHFQGRELGAVALKGIAQPVALYEVLRELDADRRFDVRASAAETPMVGQPEIDEKLRAYWSTAMEGKASVVLLSGDPGIGKSRHVQRLKDLVSNDHAQVLEASCEAGGEGTALRPIIDLLRRSVPSARRGDPDAVMAALREGLAGADGDREDAAALLASLLSVPAEGRFTLSPRPPQKQRADTFAAIRAWLVAAAARAPTLLVIEDLHWSDPSTVECLQLFLDAAPEARLLVALTARPAFKAPWGASALAHEIAITIQANLVPYMVG